MNIRRLIDKSIIGDNDISNANLRKLVDEVLERIPDSFEDDFPTFCIYQRSTPLGTYVEDVGDWYNVVFDANLLERDSVDDAIVKVGIVVNSFALMFLKYSGAADGLEGMDVYEEADNLASMWGFGREITAFRKKLGEPTLEGELS